jgi:hypothetical protein
MSIAEFGAKERMQKQNRAFSAQTQKDPAGAGSSEIAM